MRLNKGLVKGSFVLVVAFGFFNFFNFVYQITMARMLSVPDYGILASLFAMIYIFSIFAESVQTIIAKYSATENEPGKLKGVIKKSSKKAFFISLFLFLGYLAVCIPLSFLLRISYLLLSLNGTAIFLAFLIPITRGVMQGKKMFFALGTNMTIESIGKLSLAILFVYIGWNVFGAIGGVLAGSSAAYLFSFAQIKSIMKAEKKESNTDSIHKYAGPTFAIMAIIIVFYSLDVIIARIFFPEEAVGAYAIASMLAKIIFWGTLPISKAMFPISAEDSGNKKSENVLASAVILVLVCIISALAVFYFFPGFIIELFSGKVIPAAENILFYLGIAFSLVAITNLILLYRLSRGDIKGYIYMIAFVIVEILLLCLFSNSLQQYAIAFITASAIFLWGSVMTLNE